ncbi:MAG: STAS domain-containing protein [Acidimicrobiia bacterium]|jgi:anti-sigma B factor antagonist|nr:STAS domain-containing protein [Acidimicrobiia bacterium]MBA3984424.1 STAS domain-containing protein [Acidimicrobiia bacterium]MDQ3390106.1 STAS domain-containing protein [Actinomycetota bacterium]
MNAEEAAIAIVEDDDGTLRVSGELDAFSVPTLTSVLEQRAASDGGSVVLDMAGVTFVDSSALQALVEFHQRFSEQGGALLIASPSPALTRLLNITGLDKHLNVAEPSGEE